MADTPNPHDPATWQEFSAAMVAAGHRMPGHGIFGFESDADEYKFQGWSAGRVAALAAKDDTMAQVVEFAADATKVWKNRCEHAESVVDQCNAALAAKEAPTQPYSIDADPLKIRAYVADAITGALVWGAQDNNRPPAGHWLTPFWEMGRAEREAKEAPPQPGECWPERIMLQWDYWRKQIADGNDSSGPRDWFESLAPEAAATTRKSKTVAPAWTLANDKLPAEETPVLAIYRGKVLILELCWDLPGHEDSYQAFMYWDDPENDGQDIDWDDVTHWQPLPKPPTGHKGVQQC